MRSDNFTALIGAELHAPGITTSDYWHIVAVGLPLDFTPVSDGEEGPALAKRAREAGAFVAMAPPGWYQLSLVDAQTLVDQAHAVEIYNHGCQIMHDKGDGAYLLDGLLDRGHRVLTYACDDAHFRAPDFGDCWVEVKCRENRPEAVLEALKSGHFYSTQGPLIRNLEIGRDSLFIECSPGQRGHRGGQRQKTRLSVQTGAVPGGAAPGTVCRAAPGCAVTVTADGGRRAWTNPFWF